MTPFVVLGVGRDRQLQEATLVFTGISARSDAGWSSSAEQIRLATRPTDGRAGWRDVGLAIEGLKPRSAWIERLADAGLVPPQMDRLTADLAIRFDSPWTRAALETRRPQPRQIQVRDIRATWGRLDLRIAGDLNVSDSGTLDGDVLVKATNWRDILELIAATGALPDGVTATIESALEIVSSLAGRSDTLDIPVTFANGRTRIGPVPMGPAPRLRLP